MTWETHPVTSDRFEDFADVVNPNRRENHCWCLSHRIGAREIEELGGGAGPWAAEGHGGGDGPWAAEGQGGGAGPWAAGAHGGGAGEEDHGTGSRERAMRRLCERPPAPGVVTYRDGEPVGWCSIGPRSQIPRLVASKLIRPVDDVPVWSIICTVVRGGRRRRGVTTHMLEGAVGYAAEQGAPAVESYPVDPVGRMDLTMAFVGTRSMYEKAGFEVVGQTDAVASRMPRLVMRRTL